MKKNSTLKRFPTPKTLLLSLLLITFILSNSIHAGFYEEEEIQGFYFFEDPKMQSTTPKPQTPEEAAEILTEQKKELYSLRCLAILTPTEDNLIRYIQKQNQIIDQASHFAKKWQYLLLDLPELGEGIGASTSTIGIEVHKKAEAAQKLQTLESLQKNFFLLLFAEGEDPYSEAAAHILKQFSTVTHWQVRVVSTNGLPTKAFPNPQKNQGLAEKFGIKKSPTFFIVNPETKEGYPVGIGVLSVPELIEHIYSQAKRHQLEENP